jgi:hypothetical protein
MRAVAVRELIVAARTIAVPLSGWTIATLLVAFVGIWSPGVSVLAPMNLYEQTRLLQWVVLAVVLPWLAVRVSSRERADAAVMMGALTGLHPALVIASTIVARFAVLQLVSLAAIPALVISQQISAVPLTFVPRDLIPVSGLVALVAVSSTASVFIASTTPGQWLLSAAIVGAILGSASLLGASTIVAGLACLLAGGTGGAALCAAGQRSLLYLRDAHAA